MLTPTVESSYNVYRRLRFNFDDKYYIKNKDLIQCTVGKNWQFFGHEKLCCPHWDSNPGPLGNYYLQ